jgi:hypothetical protein
MVKHVQVTGKGYRLPKEAENLESPYEAVAISLAGYDSYPELKRKLKGDLQWAERILKRGPDNDSSGFAFSAAILADAIDEPLEIRLNGKKPRSLGSLLHKGTIIIKGNLGEATGHSMWGGYIFVDGNVDQVTYPLGGVIYVNGNVGEIKELYYGVLIVAGKIKKVNRDGWLNSGTYVKPSPFVFTTKAVELFGYPGTHVREEKLEKQQSFVVSEDELKEFSPENLKVKSLELCKRRMIVELDRERQSLDALATISEAIDFFKMHVNGFHEGYGRGYSQGTLDHVPCVD